MLLLPVFFQMCWSWGKLRSVGWKYLDLWGTWTSLSFQLTSVGFRRMHKDVRGVILSASCIYDVSWKVENSVLTAGSKKHTALMCTPALPAEGWAQPCHVLIKPTLELQLHQCSALCLLSSAWVSAQHPAPLSALAVFELDVRFRTSKP